MSGPDDFHSHIWEEEPEADDPFAAAACFAHGYDVYGDLLGRVRFTQYLYLLFTGRAPSPATERTLDLLMVALANPGPREASVYAAMNAGVGGSTPGACLIAALAVGAGQYGGAHEVWHAMTLWEQHETSLAAWERALRQPEAPTRADIWPPMEHPPGFNPNGESCPQPVRQTLSALAQASPGPRLAWLQEHRVPLESAAACPLAMSGVTAAALADLGLNPDQGELLTLLLRLPGAAVHALEQRQVGWRRFPFYRDALHILDDPGPVGERPDLEALRPSRGAP